MKSEVYSEIDQARRSVNWLILKTVSAVLFLIGAAAFLYGIFAGDAVRSWPADATNFVYWTGIGYGAFLLSPILVDHKRHLGKARKAVLRNPSSSFCPLRSFSFGRSSSARETVFWWVLHPERAESRHGSIRLSFLPARELRLLTMTACRASGSPIIRCESDMELIRHRRKIRAHMPVRNRFFPRPILFFMRSSLSLVSFDLDNVSKSRMVQHAFRRLLLHGFFLLGFGCNNHSLRPGRKEMGLGNLIEKKQFHDLGKLMFRVLRGGAGLLLRAVPGHLVWKPARRDPLCYHPRDLRPLDSTCLDRARGRFHNSFSGPADSASSR